MVPPPTTDDRQPSTLFSSLKIAFQIRDFVAGRGQTKGQGEPVTGWRRRTNCQHGRGARDCGGPFGGAASPELLKYYQRAARRVRGRAAADALGWRPVDVTGGEHKARWELHKRMEEITDLQKAEHSRLPMGGARAPAAAGRE